MSYDLRRPRGLGDYGSKLLFGNKRSAEGSCVRMGENRKLTYTSSWPEWMADGRAEKFVPERVANVPPGFT